MNGTRPIEALRLHPDAERVPLADRADLASLRNSLRENGQQDPIDITPDDVILDGRTRWKLLGELGAQSVQVRVNDIPPDQQTHYIVDRALARRHLTPDQKRALNDLMRGQVIEERPTKRGNVMRIGRSQTQRAATLGLDQATVSRWDADAAGYANAATSPTHAIDKRGRPQPIHKSSANIHDLPQRGRKSGKALAPTPKRSAPAWGRFFTRWCRAVLPEDRAYLIQMCVELHKALDLLGLTCEGDD